MRVLNYGSLNIDHVYAVDHFVRPGESLPSRSYAMHPGGKGANQSTAMALAGADVAHAGKVGRDGAWYRDRLAECGVDVQHVDIVDTPSGHAMIQVNPQGENAIVLYGGANREIAEADAARVLGAFSAGDFLLLQNEISAIPAIMRTATERGLRIVFNAAPMHAEVKSYPLELVDLFIVNEIEGAELTGETNTDKVLDAMLATFPKAGTVLTLGSKGARYGRGDTRLSAEAHRVHAVDTTAAGDTFIGYLLAELANGGEMQQALEMGCAAAAVCVTRPGAASSIPRRDEVVTGGA
ncbi:MAG: ribokinase [Chitinivibrionales bacterium]|nr:ribokinase [Chitinivibrionales bacterium]